MSSDLERHIISASENVMHKFSLTAYGPSTW